MYFFETKSGIVLIDLPPLPYFSQFFVQLSKVIAVFLTSHVDHCALLELIKLQHSLKIYCTNQCAKFLIRVNTSIATNIIILGTKPTEFDDLIFVSIPTPLCPYPSS